MSEASAAGEEKKAPSPTDTSSRMSKICEHVFVGGYRAAVSPDLEKNGIKNVLKMFRDESGYKRAPRVRYLVINIKDGDRSQFLKKLPKSLRFIRRGKGATLVHCHMGISRAPSVAIAHLMVDHQMNYDTAFAAVKKAHPQTEIKFGAVLRDIDSRWRSTREI